MELDSGPVAMRIPYEILREIVLYMYTYMPQPGGVFDEIGFIPISQKPPIPASHVCRSWRYALLSDPTLWTCLFIPKTKPGVITELLRRSGSALLTIFFVVGSSENGKLDPADTSDTLSSVFQQIHRFKTLHMYIHFDCLWDPPEHLEASIKQVFPYLKRPAPELQTLFSAIYVDTNLERTISNALFSMDAPNLKYIFNHQLSSDIGELHSPSFHGLLKLDLNIPNYADVDGCLLLNFLELSPCLQFLRIFTHWPSSYIRLFSEDPIPRKVNLPHIQKLTLQVNRTTELMDLILSNVIFPETFTWNINSLHLPEFTHWPPLVQLLSRAQFTSLSILFSGDSDTEKQFVKLAFEESHDSEYANKFASLYDDMSRAANHWDPLMQSISSINITHLRLVFDTSLECIPFSRLFASLQSLESLSIKASVKDIYLSCLSTLTPKMEGLAVSKYNNTSGTMTCDTGSMQDSALNIVPANGPEDTQPFPNLEISVFPCLFLRELYIDLKDIPLDELLAFALNTCYDRRCEEGYPLKFFVQCPEIIWDDVQPILQLRDVEPILPLQLREGGLIHVEVRP